MINLFKILIFILLCFLIGFIIATISNFEGCKLFYLSNEGAISFVIDMFILFATLCAALANLGMLQSNQSMVTAANNEIELLKVQHRYLISPIIKLDGDSFGIRSIKLSNCTNNPAINLTIFAKLYDKEYVSESFFVEKEGKVQASLNNNNNIEVIFKNKYGNRLNSFEGFDKIFRQFLQKKADMIFTVYTDVEGNIHGTASTCTREINCIPPEPYSTFDRSRYTEEELTIIYTRFYPKFEHFYILSETSTSTVRTSL